MMKFILALISLLAIFSRIHSTESEAISCKNSYDCPQNSCCRTSDGTLLGSNSGWNPWLPLFETEVEGFCSTKPSQSGEICDQGCGCETGLTCYRPVTGACCPPLRCYDSAYVLQQNDYWANCKPPTCFFPPKYKLHDSLGV